MEAVIGSSSPYLKFDKHIGFPSLRDDLFGKAFMRSPSNTKQKNKYVDFKLSLSTRRAFRPISLSSSHTQVEVENLEMQLEESLDGYTNEAEMETIRVKFQLRRECSFGQNFLMVGDDPMLGLWDPNNAIPLTWSNGHVWTVDLDIPVGKCIKFKFIMQESNGKFMWQPGPDRVLEFWETSKTITLYEDWENPNSRRIIEDEEIPSEDINLKQVLDEGVPVLVPGLTQLPKTDTVMEMEPPKDETNSMYGTAVAAHDLQLPELDSKGDVNSPSNLNQTTEISSIDENQDSFENENKLQETQQIAEEQDHQSTQPIKSLFNNDIQWGKNILQKLLNCFGIQ